MANRHKAAEVVADEKTAGSMLLTIAAAIISLDGLQWDPEAIRDAVEKTLNVRMPPKNFNKLMAAVNIATSDRYWKSSADFIVLNNALASGVINLDTFDVATVEEVAIGLSECCLIWPQPADQFSDAVVNYINGIRMIERFTIPPKIVSLLFGNKCPIWQDDIYEFSDDSVLYESIYKQALAKAEEVDKEVLSRLDVSIAQAEEVELDKTAAYIKGMRKLLT